MPFPMIHLVVNNEILKKGLNTKSPEDFLLGGLSPDAVHYRDDFSTSYKFESHMCVGDRPWGFIEDFTNWHKRVDEFIERDISDSFRLGYAVHILTDISWSVDFWAPFRKKAGYKPAPPKDPTKGFYNSPMHIEQTELEFWLYLEYPESADIYEKLKRSNPRDMNEFIPGGQREDLNHLVSAQEVTDIRDHMLYKQYAGRTPNRDMEFNLLSLEKINGFIEMCSEKLYRKLIDMQK